MGYGQTGSGKSFTINGLRNNWEHRGLVARLLSHMFIEKANRKKVSKIEYCVSFIELYGKEARDLLTCNMDNRVKINERDPFKMHIVEVAGTGKIGRNNCLKTAMDIGMANLTKTQLEQFFSCIGNSGMSAISIIRSSNLLKILRNAFSVSSIVRFISHIQITKEDLGITLSTLRLTAKIGKLKPIRMKEDVKYRSDLMVHRLQDEVNALKKELMINNLFLHQEAFMNISKSRMEQINRNILNFLNDKISDFTLFSASQAQVLLKNIKNLYNRLAAKELEVEELKETYESLVKSVTQFSTSENLPMETVISTDDYTNNRKRIKSSSQVTEAEKIIQEMEKEEVGSLDKSKVISQAKRNLDDARDKLDKHQQIRYVLELGNHERTKIIIEIEKTIERDILCHRKVLVNLEEEVNQAQDEITTLSNQHLEMISKLESAFREYCKKKDFLVYYTDESMKMLLKPTTTESLEIIRCKFNKFQRAMLRKTEERGRTKKARLDNKRMCNSVKT
ncbi:PREDICTED: osmotic avoidance abnormal protein 3-like [Habropoda laboriosa]|uniref:osmotic avoidance abnormal protein 3-like n=1 Tax=Habropoda laboriosa TaxID=597456 RepID=UPI00083E3195|nr:PREDICTED: osmotic avoidance abnormal protein 3-like [Habropoda laboriosa]